MDRKRNGQMKIILWNQSIFPFSLLSECFNPHRQNYQFIRTFLVYLPTYLPKYKVLFFIFVCLIYGKTSYLFNQEGKSRFHLGSLVLFFPSIPLFKFILTLTFGVSTKMKVQNNKRNFGKGEHCKSLYFLKLNHSIKFLLEYILSLEHSFTVTIFPNNPASFKFFFVLTFAISYCRNSIY